MNGTCTCQGLPDQTSHFINTLISSIYDNIVIGLMNLNLVEQVGWEHLHHVVPDVNSHVLSCADNTGKVWDVLIQVFMVQWNHDDFLDAPLQVCQVHDHASERINLSTHCYLHFVVVSMTIGVVAFSINSFILLITQVNAVESVTGAEALGPRDVSNTLSCAVAHIYSSHGQ